MLCFPTLPVLPADRSTCNHTDTPLALKYKSERHGKSGGNPGSCQTARDERRIFDLPVNPESCSVLCCFCRGCSGREEPPLHPAPTPALPYCLFVSHLWFKITVDPPQGLQSNLLQTFGYSGNGEITEEMFEKPTCGLQWKKLLFTMCFINAVINERRNYGTSGWNIAYLFSPSDLEVGSASSGQVTV